MEPRLLSASEVAFYLGVSVSTVRKMVKRGELPKPTVISDRIKRFDRTDIDEILDQKRQGNGLYVDPDDALAE